MINFYFLWHCCIILKKWKPPRNSLFCDWSMFSRVHPSIDAVKMRQNVLFKGSFWYDFSGSQPAFCIHFQGQSSAKGLWRDLLKLFLKSQNQQVRNSLKEANFFVFYFFDGEASKFFRGSLMCSLNCYFFICLSRLLMTLISRREICPLN